MVAAGIAILNISVKSLLRCKINFFNLLIAQVLQDVNRLTQKHLKYFQA